MSQIIDENVSCCSKAVSMVQAWCAEAQLPVPASDTGGYCMARKRLTMPFLKGINEHLSKLMSRLMSRRIRTLDRWHGHVLKAIDGTSVKLMDTLENQEQYPQPSTQKPGCGFPVMGMAGKTLAMLMIAYNLIKAVSQQAAIENGRSLAMMGFKWVLDIVVSCRSNYRGHKYHAFKRKTLHRTLIEIISTKLLDKRPGR